MLTLGLLWTPMLATVILATVCVVAGLAAFCGTKSTVTGEIPYLHEPFLIPGTTVVTVFVSIMPQPQYRTLQPPAIDD